MNATWERRTPIDSQVRDRAVAMILDGSLKPGDALPHVPSAAADLRVNPVIVARAYRQLVEEELVEAGRTEMVIAAGAPEKVRQSERQRFTREIWPAILDCMHRLGLEPSELDPSICPG